MTMDERIETIHHYAESLRQDVGKLFARLDALRLESNAKRNSEPILTAIIETVADFYGVNPGSLVRSRKHVRHTNKLSEIRWIAFRMARKYTNQNAKAIGRAFASDRTTVTYGLVRCEELMGVDPDYRRAVEMIDAKFSKLLTPDVVGPVSNLR